MNKMKYVLPLVILITIALIVILRLLTTMKSEKFMNLQEIEANVDVPLKDVFNKANTLIKNNDSGVMNKKIRDKILNMVLNKKVADPKSEISNMGSERNTETNDFVRKIFDMENQIFTDSVNHELLCNNLKYELIKLVEDNKPVSVIMREFDITSKKNV